MNDTPFLVGHSGESYNKQLKIKSLDNKEYRFAELLTILGEVIDNSIVIERHFDRYSEKTRSDKNLKMSHVLISAFEDSDGIVPVKLLVKEFNDERNNKLHVAITLPIIEKAGIVGAKKDINPSNTPTPTSIYSIADILSIIKKDLPNDSVNQM